MEIPPGALTNNTAGVPILVACTKADLIDDNNDIAGAGAAGMGGMVKGKGGEWEERTDGIMQVLRTICLRCMFLAMSIQAIIYLTVFRWRISILYHPSTRNTANITAIRSPYVVHTGRTIARFRTSRATTEPIPVHS